MATLDLLKIALRQKAADLAVSSTQPLSDSQYDTGFKLLAQDSGNSTYEGFIIPQLSLLLEPLLESRSGTSILEIGPGPKSILGNLPTRQRRKIKKYAAFEPNESFANKLEAWLTPHSHAEIPLPNLEDLPSIRRIPLNLRNSARVDAMVGTKDDDESFDVILFCHSMYGMDPKREIIEKALKMLARTPEDAIVVVFHRAGTLHFDGLVCHRTASRPTGIIRIENDNEVLDSFARFIAGFAVQEVDTDRVVRAEWRKICLAFGRREEAHPYHIHFDAPEIMVAFTRHATTLPELSMNVPLASGGILVKNREARHHRPSSVAKPQEVRHVQQCVRWALKHGVGLTIVGGGHSGQCLWPNVVALDMSAFNQVHVVTAEQGAMSDAESDTLIVVEAGCKAGDVIRTAMPAGFTVPLGARPSVGAGLWLQGGIGHLARLHGLACDAILGAVVVDVASGEVLCVGQVPSQHQPTETVHPENDSDLLWGLKGAGTNLGIVISVTFQASPAPAYSIQNWMVPLRDRPEAESKLQEFDQLANKLPRYCSADAYLYWEQNKLHLGASLCESSTTGFTCESLPLARAIFGHEGSAQIVDGIGMFDTEMYMFGMHGGHAGGKTSAFKRCLFLKNIGADGIVDLLYTAVEDRPSPNCYLHLLQGGGAIGDVAAGDTAFGCRDWDLACVITGVWRRNEDNTASARAAVEWVYNVVKELLPLSSGVYGADLGPDPRDAALAAKAFGPNRSRLARLKYNCDPSNVLAYACPLPRVPTEPKLIVLVTGEEGAGKDHCARIWVSAFAKCAHASLSAIAVSISDSTKQEYASATGADLKRLVEDRLYYKEQHRSALSAYFREQVRLRPQLPQEHFLNAVYNAWGVDVLFITGMRDEAPVAAFSHLVPDSRVLEVRITADREMRRARRGFQDRDAVDDAGSSGADSRVRETNHNDSCSSFVFNNNGNTTSIEAANRFAARRLLPPFDKDLQQLNDMVRVVPNFPQRGIDFRDVLGISQQPGGLLLCTSLLQTHFAGDWAKVDVVACCETGGFLYAPLLAAQVNLPLALVRDAGKLPPPTVSLNKHSSYISSSGGDDPKDKSIEMDRDAVPRGAAVVIVDDVLATGETLCAMLQLLGKVGVGAENVKVMVVAEFPSHDGRGLLRRRGFGGVNAQSLLVFGGR